MTEIYVKPLSISSLDLKGDITALMINNNNGNIVSNLQNWDVSIEWNLRGTFLDIFPFADCRWDVRAFLEGWGSNTNESEFEGVTQPLLVDGVNRTVVPSTIKDPTTWKYTEKINIKAGDLKPGPYKLAITLTLIKVDLTDPKKPVDVHPLPIAGFIEYPEMIQIFKD